VLPSPFTNIAVTGENITYYQYKMGNTFIDCNDYSDYSEDVDPHTTIEEDVTALSTNSRTANSKVCAIGINVYNGQRTLSLPVSATWRTNNTRPIATATNVPTGTNTTTTLNITINTTNSDIAYYKYKIGLSTTLDCTTSSGYSSYRAASIKITNNISTLSDAEIKLCVMAKDIDGNVQNLAQATTFTWTKNANGPTAILSNVPTQFNSLAVPSLNISVSSIVPGDIFSYRYKVGTASMDCAVSTNYSSDILAIIPITDIITTLNTNTIVANSKICVVAKDSLGNEQPLASATSASWITDLNAPVATLSGTPNAQDISTALNISVSAVVAADITHYKYRLVTGATSCTSSTASYVGPVAKTTNITNSLTGYGNGTTLKVCVVGIDAHGNQQSFATATSITWIKYNPCNNVAASFASGAGVSGFPYSITNLAHLQAVRSNPTCHYRLNADIDLGPSGPLGAGYVNGFAPIGTSSSNFRGEFDGNNYSISNWTYSAASTDYIGFFGYTHSATMKDLKLIAVNVTGKNHVGELYMNDATSIPGANLYWDILGTGQSVCGQTYDPSVMGCTGINPAPAPAADPNYFKDAVNAPLNSWDTSVWLINGIAYPTLIP
jgi:hypothetical protein